MKYMNEITPGKCKRTFFFKYTSWNIKCRIYQKEIISYNQIQKINKMISFKYDLLKVKVYKLKQKMNH